MLCMLGSTASQTVAPYFFGLVVDAALKSMGEWTESSPFHCSSKFFRKCIVLVRHFIRVPIFTTLHQMSLWHSRGANASQTLCEHLLNTSTSPLFESFEPRKVKWNKTGQNELLPNCENFLKFIVLLIYLCKASFHESL